MSVPFVISFNLREEFSEYEKFAIVAMLEEYYHKCESFAEKMDILYNQVNVVKKTHLNKEDNKSHFNITLFNDFRMNNRMAKKQSSTMHVYTDYKKVLLISEYMKINY
jgi:hypothetical protein